VVSDVASGSPVIYYVHADHLGRPVRMTAQNKARVWDVIYSPFGETSYIRTIPGTIDIRFPGQWFPLESGLAYNWHRHYDASLGRYVQPDPLGLTALLSDGPSAYGYVGQNPLAHADPLGLMQLPNDPSGLPGDWIRDLSHRDPNGIRFRDADNNILDFHQGRQGERGWKGKNHWHYNEGNNTFRPATTFQILSALRDATRFDSSVCFRRRAQASGRDYGLHQLTESKYE
jgi:RHS repeat-associated protein